MRAETLGEVVTVDCRATFYFCASKNSVSVRGAVLFVAPATFEVERDARVLPEHEHGMRAHGS